MFNELLESAVVKKQTKKGLAFVASAGFQLACLVVLLLLPLIYTQALPKAIIRSLVISVVPSPLEPTRAQVASAPAPKRTVHFMRDTILRAPTRIPPTVSMLNESELPPELPANPFLSEFSGVNLVDAQPDSTHAPAPPKPSSELPRVKLGGDVQAAKILSRIQPIYPVLALQAGIQGEVILHAIIGKEGRVSELEVISGHPLLARAALEAVKQWRYQPTMLNREPVEVDTTITVTFALGR